MILAVIISVGLVVSSLSAGTVYFDLGDAFVVDDNWNTVADWGVGVHIDNAIDHNGNPTNISYNCTSGFAMNNSGGETNVTAYPTAAGRDSFYLSSTNNNARILIGGLTAGNSYDFKFFGSRAATGPRAVDITIGSQTVYHDSALNKSNVAIISDVVAPQSGIVTINVNLASNSTFGYLGVIEINGEFDPPQEQPEGIFVAPWGLDSNPGTYAWPKASMQGAFDAVASYKQAKELPDGGLDVYFRGGHYYFASTAIASAGIDGETEKFVTFKPYKDDKVIFDGSQPLDSRSFTLVTDQNVLDRLGNGAEGNVYQSYITDTSMRQRLSDAFAVLDFDGKMAQVSRYLNIGNGHIKTVLDPGAVYTAGRTPGEPPQYSMDEPIGAEFTIFETDAARWEQEYQSVKKARLIGYLANDWYKDSHRIADVSAGAVKLLEYSRYEINNRGARRFYVLNLMCELDSPGEWYFDETTNILYVFPYEAITEQSSIGVWTAPEFIRVYCSNVRFEDFIIQGTAIGASGSGMVTFYDGDNTVFSGCTFRNTSRPAVSFMTNTASTNSGITGCDIYDVSGHLNLYGGSVSPTEITHGGNFAINCHFTQVQSRDYTGRIAVRGVGNIFRNNLVHNLAGDSMSPGGNDLIIEKNEVFNTGFEVGDGGAMYWANAMWSYGNIFKHNFVHHIMCTPGFHPRGGMYPDQLDAGDTFKQNIFYKAGHRALLINGGAAQRAEENIFLEGYIGIYQTESYAQQAYNDIPLYDNGTLTRGDVGDYVWRTEQVVGAQGWNNEPWASRYPVFATVMNQEMMRFWPIENYFIGNMFHGNLSSNFQYRYSSSSTTTDINSTPSYIHKSDNRDITLDVFKDPSTLNFKFVDDAPAWAPDIPFENIGLYIGDGRTRMPDKATYRKMVKQRFASRPSFDDSASYDPATITDLIYFNSGQLLMNLASVSDLNNDGKTDLLDFSILASEWFDSQSIEEAYSENFDSFELGAFVSQQGWNAHSSMSVVAAADNGLYIGGRALKVNSSGDDWVSAGETGLDMDIKGSTSEAVRISFDLREGTNPNEGTTLFSARMFLRQAVTGNYSPSFGMGGGKVILRPAGEQGDTIEGNTLASSTYHGEDKYWQKGDWLRFTMVLNGDDLQYATVLIHNLSKDKLEIPSGLVNVDTGKNMKNSSDLWNRPTIRLGNSTNTYIDNIYIGNTIQAELTADINQDGVVDFHDLDFLFNQWLMI